MNQPNQLIRIVNPETGDEVTTTRKVLANYYDHQGYVEKEDDSDDRAPFLEISPAIPKSTRQPALRGAAKAAADKKAAK